MYLNNIYLKNFQVNKKTETKKNLNGNVNGNEFQEPLKNSISNLKAGKINQEYYRWDNLIHIEIICFIGGNCSVNIFKKAYFKIIKNLNSTFD